MAALAGLGPPPDPCLLAGRAGLSTISPSLFSIFNQAVWPYIHTSEEIAGTTNRIRSNELHKADPTNERMPLNRILTAWNEPVEPKIVKDIITYMKSMPTEQETLVLQCAEHLEKSQTLSAVLAVVHALNDGEILMRCRDEDMESDFSREFERLMGDSVKNQGSD